MMTEPAPERQFSNGAGVRRHATPSAASTAT
jgi:hypothetical protein